jgi:hypothetical protein
LKEASTHRRIVASDLLAYKDKSDETLRKAIREMVAEGQLAMTGLFRARWSSDIHREWMAAVSQNTT